jgi:hypothetical protein
VDSMQKLIFYDWKSAINSADSRLFNNVAVHCDALIWMDFKRNRVRSTAPIGALGGHEDGVYTERIGSSSDCFREQ